MEDKYSVNRRIKKFIDDNDKRSSAIADKAGIRRDIFSRIICCRRMIYAEELIPILNALGMPLKEAIDAVEEDALCANRDEAV